MKYIKIVLVAFCLSSSAEAPRLLPFQARIADSNGVLVPDGTKLVQFKIYNTPIGGSAVWLGEIHRTSINAGMVTVILGSKASFDSVDFNQTLYLEITVDSNADDQITSIDPPLLPRQAVLPVIFAKEAADSRLLAGHAWNVILANGATNPNNGKIDGRKLAAGTISSNEIASEGIAGFNIASGAVSSNHIAAGAISSNQLVSRVIDYLIISSRMGS